MVMTFPEFWDALSEWSQATFGSHMVRGPFGPTKHLAKEVLCELLGFDREFVTGLLKTATYKAYLFDVEEFADCIFLVFDAAQRAGYTFDQLAKAVTDKLAKNKARSWGPPTSDGITEHLR